MANEAGPAEQGTETWPGAGGTGLLARWWRPAEPPRGVVLIVHGLGEHAGRYAPHAAALVARGYAVYSFDLRGHGRSPGPRAYVDRFATYLADLDAMLAAVRAREPDRPLFLLGHSMGGTIVALYVLTRQPTLAGVVLSSPALAPGSDISPLLARLAPLIGRLAPRLPASPLDPAAISHDPAVVRAYAEDPLVLHRGMPARTGAELLAAIGQVQAQMDAWSLPLLLIHGTADRLTNPAGSQALARRAAVADKTLRLYDGFYHETLNEPEGARVLADLGGWLDAHTAA